MQTIFEKPTFTTCNSKLRLSPVPTRFSAPALPAPRRSTSLEPAPQRAVHSSHLFGAAEQQSLVQALTGSKVFQQYERAFTEATGLPLALRPVESWQLPLHGKKHESSWCALMASKSRACANCLQVQEQLAQKAVDGPQTITCGSGLSETMVPVRLGERLVGYLQTGQVFHHAPTEVQFERTAKLMRERGVELDGQEMRQAYFKTSTMPARQHESAVGLLSIFAQHLSILSNQILVRQQNTEPPVIVKARKYIEEHQTEDISLTDVAKAVNTSTFYFCKMFRKVTGLNFTDYLARLRIERAKNLLLNQNLRVSEIAFEVGFQSLTHFNRVFKRILGQSPTEYRIKLGGNG